MRQEAASYKPQAVSGSNISGLSNNYSSPLLSTDDQLTSLRQERQLYINNLNALLLNDQHDSTGIGNTLRKWIAECGRQISLLEKNFQG